MLNAKNSNAPKKVYEVTLYVDDKEIMKKEVDMYHYIIRKRINEWARSVIAKKRRPGYSITEVKKWSVSSSEKSRVVVAKVSLMKLFLGKTKFERIHNLFLQCKNKLNGYVPVSKKGIRLRYKFIELKNSVLDEFCHTANVCDETIWKWEDFLETYDKTGYLLSECWLERSYDLWNEAELGCEKKKYRLEIVKSWKDAKKEDFLSHWTQYLVTLEQHKVYEVLKFVQNFNLDTEDEQFVKMFKEDFMSAGSDQSFASVLLKWNDLILWSPWKRDLFKESATIEFNNHWESETNPDFNEFFAEEV